MELSFLFAVGTTVGVPKLGRTGSIVATQTNQEGERSYCVLLEERYQCWANERDLVPVASEDDRTSRLSSALETGEVDLLAALLPPHWLT